jgi:PAS domain S-box-containing protein
MIRTIRILHVEDNPRDAKLCHFELERAGFGVQADIVATSEDFLAALDSATYDIVLADYRLPGWCGLDALAILRERGRETPFILVTGTIGEELAVESIKKGAADYILKDRLARLSLAVERAIAEVATLQERRKAEENRNLLASIVESSDDAIIGIAPDETILTWNSGASRIYRCRTEEMLGKPFGALFAPDAIAPLQAAMKAIARGEGVARYETQGKTRDGRLIEVAVSLSPIHPAGASAIIRDTTEQKQRQKEFFAAQKMEAIGRLAAGVAHDFNNLLTVVTGYCGILLGHFREEDPLYEGISEIAKASDRAIGLTRQLLAFSRKQVLQPRVLDLNTIVADMDRMLRRLIGEDIDLVTLLAPNLGAVNADPGQIEQVIMNLAINARDAMPKGGKLTIDTVDAEVQEVITHRRLKMPAGSYVVLSVTDTGSGMTPEIQERIFEPFFTTKNPGEGTGLGLSTVYGIVEQSGGTILVYSELGIGTTFRVYLPRVQRAAAPADVLKPAPPPRGSETILVVEDEDAVRALLCSILQKQGYVLLRARNGAEGLLVCEKYAGKIDLMMTDVIMPSMNGSDLAERLRSVRPGMRVLFMSGYTDAAIMHHGVLSAGAAFIEKPFTMQAVARKVREVLDAVAPVG